MAMDAEFPAYWTTSLTDLLADRLPKGLRISDEEERWARAYETSELRKWARFPREGEIYEAVSDTSVHYFTHWRAPFTGGGDAVLPGGARVRIGATHFVEPISVSAIPLERERLEAILVPETERCADKYGGYSLWLPTAQLNKNFRLCNE